MLMPLGLVPQMTPTSCASQPSARWVMMESLGASCSGTLGDYLLIFPCLQLYFKPFMKGLIIINNFSMQVLIKPPAEKSPHKMC